MLSKVKGTANPADAMTKALPYDIFIFYHRLMGIVLFNDPWGTGNPSGIAEAEIEGAASSQY